MVHSEKDKVAVEVEVQLVREFQAIHNIGEPSGTKINDNNFQTNFEKERDIET